MVAFGHTHFFCHALLYVVHHAQQVAVGYIG